MKIKSLIALLYILFYCALSGAQTYCFTFYKISTHIAEEMDEGALENYFDAAIKAGKFELLGQFNVENGSTAISFMSKQIRFPEAYDDNLMPVDFVAYDLGISVELTPRTKDGILSLAMNTKYTSRVEDLVYKTPKGDIAFPTFAVAEVRTVFTPKLGLPILLLPQKNIQEQGQAENSLFIMKITEQASK